MKFVFKNYKNQIVQSTCFYTNPIWIMKKKIIYRS